ncbi:ADP-ribosylglycohydrolase family protein [Algoriphagus halophytocola]|uniref:ADP-ribosylglycohydrolase family protein n=1 Tax=Algoriphagus halophytocola TaxID=2991499 RepID=A0ABY6MKB2_9BACT|nr:MULTISPECIES: ADP-ribosylglycohydrolase family protein [unclassified Algoriphagus]UZD23101.1 ADP-ribosylglycohydrolase family protein [Algoriphagus sp. TR-M5]WBL44393.1 ADP-ribosylglycohydrolase family protein [Algoriphagus sp. TR-M9]
MRNSLLILMSMLLLSACNTRNDERSYAFTEKKLPKINLTEKQLQDKILGMLVGSAIGDAMGAPTEMWSRDDINLQYGFVTTLDDMVREVSPEGIWVPNLPAGGTTDDTRWKILTGEYLLSQNPEGLNARDFAAHISYRYRTYIEEFQSIESTDPEPFEEVSLKMGWLQEWAKVSEPFIQDNLTGYADSLGKFYGGEMVCAGLLYAPSIGAFFPGNPEKAYRENYKLTIYDLGYAKDISSLAAAMTAAGMGSEANKDSLLASLKIDPAQYFQSRLVGRTAHGILTQALRIGAESAELDSLGNRLNPESAALQHAFSQLDQRLQDMPFHAGEIWLQTLSAMIYSDFDFMGTLTFLVNYGRDNDTTAAVAGGILGAYYGFSKLPEVERASILKVNKELLGIDLELMANQLTAHMIATQ